MKDVFFEKHHSFDAHSYHILLNSLSKYTTRQTGQSMLLVNIGLMSREPHQGLIEWYSV
uniref:Uncharacterized protein n=1 Tax=Anguilla anguilla TaxID=7936 RepID=A0A0E9Q260_ANGAN